MEALIDQFMVHYGVQLIGCLFVLIGMGLGWFFNKIVNRLDQIDANISKHTIASTNNYLKVEKELALINRSQLSTNIVITSISEKVENLTLELNKLKTEVAILMDREEQT